MTSVQPTVFTVPRPIHIEITRPILNIHGTSRLVVNTDLIRFQLRHNGIIQDGRTIFHTVLSRSFHLRTTHNYQHLNHRHTIRARRTFRQRTLAHNVRRRHSTRTVASYHRVLQVNLQLFLRRVRPNLGTYTHRHTILRHLLRRHRHILQVFNILTTTMRISNRHTMARADGVTNTTLNMVIRTPRLVRRRRTKTQTFSHIIMNMVAGRLHTITTLMESFLDLSHDINRHTDNR